jgi:hypothetical protein
MSEYLIDTPVFDLEYSTQSKLNFDVPLEVGIHKSITRGYFIILKSLEVGEHEINLGCYNNIDAIYYTKAIYNINTRPYELEMNDNPL